MAAVGTARRWAWAISALAIVAASVALGCSSGVDEARALEEAGDWQGALAVYEGILAEDEDDLLALSGAAVALMVMQRWDEALVYQKLVVAADPTDAQTRVELGFNYLNHQELPRDAVGVFTEAVAIEPSSKHLCFLAQAQESSGDAKGAEESLRRAITADAKYVYSYKLLVGLLESQGRDEEATELIGQAQSLGLDVGGPG